jgi:hypothetical protein
VDLKLQDSPEKEFAKLKEEYRLALQTGDTATMEAVRDKLEILKERMLALANGTNDWDRAFNINPDLPENIQRRLLPLEEKFTDMCDNTWKKIVDDNTWTKDWKWLDWSKNVFTKGTPEECEILHAQIVDLRKQLHESMEYYLTRDSTLRK